MRFRFTNGLILGLAVAVVGGCSCGDRCRVPLLKRIGGGVMSRLSARDDVALANGSIYQIDPGDCRCDQPISSISSETVFSGLNETGYEPSEMSILPEATIQPAQPDFESLEIPKPPSDELRNGLESSIPQLEGTIVPDDDTGYFTPSLRRPSRNTEEAIEVVEPGTPAIDEITNQITNQADLLALEFESASSATIEPKPKTSSGEVEPLNAWQPPQTVDAPAEQSPSLLQLQQADDQEISVLDWEPRRVKATPISTSKTTEPPVIHEVRPVPFGIMNEDPVQFQRQTLPAKSDERGQDPVVLHAIPIKNHRVNDARIADARLAKARIEDTRIANPRVTDVRVADARGVDRYGFPSGDAVRFQNLPELDGRAQTDTPVYMTTPDSPFEEPSAESQVPAAETVPQFHSLPPSGLNTNGYTSPTSYQVPMENDASVLLDVEMAIDCGLVDRKQNFLQPKIHAVPNSDTTTSQQRSLFKIVRPLETKQLQILRMQATTPSDRQLQIPPIVSIKSVMEPVIVRGVHPEANLPIAGSETTIPGSESWPRFDEDRLDASIRGMSSRLATPDKNESTTIDR